MSMDTRPSSSPKASEQPTDRMPGMVDDFCGSLSMFESNLGSMIVGELSWAARPWHRLCCSGSARQAAQLPGVPLAGAGALDTDVALVT
jgi:hypothetical protein